MSQLVDDQLLQFLISNKDGKETKLRQFFQDIQHDQNNL